MMILCTLISLIILVVGGFIIVDRVRHGSFYKDAAREFTIPGLSDNYTPQGFDYLAEQDIFLCCGYMSDGTASRIYTVDKDYQSSAPITIKNADGSDHLGHAGGITAFPGTDHVYLASDGCLHRLSLADILDGDGVVTIKEDLFVMLEPAYCTVYGNDLYVGSYYYPEKYETPESERYVTPAGDQNYALLAIYPLDPDTGKLLTDKPDTLVSTCGMVQGMAFADADTMILSTSWGLSTSHLYCYDLTKLDPAQSGTYTFSDGSQIPIFFLDSTVCYADIIAPCMAEELVVRDGRVYIMNEAASNKYIFGKLLGAQRLYSYPVPVNEEP
ncbi:MAG: hypothetical protein IJW40_01875 [Clostridia bacterium]|nr:hypothetical protein [Clostridia bacterium]